jgi:hypothetical protein
MGYELDQLMRQFGVSSPSLSYTGAAAPVAPTVGVTDYQTLLNKYNTELPQYQADRAAYDAYAQQYMDKVNPSSIYNQPQFNTGVSNIMPLPLYSQQQPQQLVGPLQGAPVLAPPVYSYRPSTPLNGVPGVSSSVGGAGLGVASPTYNQNIGSDYSGQPSNPSGYNSNSYTGGLVGAMLGMDYAPDPSVSVSDRGTSVGAFGGSSVTGVGNPGESAQDSGGYGATGNESASDYGGVGGSMWNKGGSVKTHFADGGLNDLSEIADRYGEGAQMAYPEVATPAEAAAPGASFTGGAPDLMAMLSRYETPSTAYGTELSAARQAAGRETEAFNKMLQGAISQQGDSAPSKAEMYFRLAAAFGAPTRTGGFAESLGNVGKTLGEYSKETREAEKAGRTARLQLGLEAQKAKMTGAKEDLTTLRTLAGEEMKDKRAIATELLKDYVASGKPQSTAGKQALDEGLQPGTPAFQRRVSAIAELNIEKQMATINATLAGVTTGQANLGLREQGLNLQQLNLGLQQRKFEADQQAKAKLTPAEMKLKTETEDAISATDSGMSALKQAYALNPNTFDASLLDTAQRKLLEAAGSKDPKVINTRLQENLLSEKALAGLKTAFGGNPTEGERKIILDLQGIGSKSKEERAAIMKNAFKSLKTARDRQQKRLGEISQGSYRDVTPTAEGLE